MVRHSFTEEILIIFFQIVRVRMPATREMSGSTCSVEMEEEWKREEGGSMSGWGSPRSITLENEEGVSEQVQMDPDEYRGAHFNFAHFGVGYHLTFMLEKF